MIRGIDDAASVLEEIGKEIGKDKFIVMDGFLWIALTAMNGGRSACRKFVLELSVGDLLQGGMGLYIEEPVVQANGCRSFTRLAQYGDDEVGERLVRDGAGQLVVSAMRAHEGNRDVQRWGCGAIYHLLQFKENLAMLRDIPWIGDALRRAAEKHPDSEFYDALGVSIKLKFGCLLILEKLTGTSAASASVPPARRSMVKIAAEMEIAKARVEELRKEMLSSMEM